LRKAHGVLDLHFARASIFAEDVYNKLPKGVRRKLRPLRGINLVSLSLFTASEVRKNPKALGLYKLGAIATVNIASSLQVAAGWGAIPIYLGRQVLGNSLDLAALVVARKMRDDSTLPEAAASLKNDYVKYARKRHKQRSKHNRELVRAHRKRVAERKSKAAKEGRSTSIVDDLAAALLADSLID
jgi:hypothetical protein